MSSLSINGLGQRSSGPFQSVSSCSGQPSASSISATGGSGLAGAQKAGGHRHRHGGGNLFQQIRNAVTSALQSARSSGSASDPNKVIEDAIAKVFKQAAGGSSPSPATTAATTAQAGGDDPDGDSHTNAPRGINPNNSPQQAFLKSLQSLGVSPRQFRNDFLAAIKDAQQGGPLDASAALKSLPLGSTLDTIG